MTETEITLLVNRKPDLDLIKQKIIANKIQYPVYILQYEDYYQINLTSDYEQWELDDAILACFPEYQFTFDLERGRKEIRLQLSRYQSDHSTDGWGRPIPNPLNETKYLVKKSDAKSEKFNPEIKVLFGDSEKSYFINIVNGINKTSGEEGFLLVNEFKTKQGQNKPDIFKDKLYKSPLEAFQSGHYKVQELVTQDFNEHIKNEKKKLSDQQKHPRKIIRDFINSCNNFNLGELCKKLDNNIIFEKRVNWQTTLKTEGINEFKQYVESPNQEICSRNLKIRPSWDFDSRSVTIGIKYYPTAKCDTNETINMLKYGRISFVINGDKILEITEEG